MATDEAEMAVFEYRLGRSERFKAQGRELREHNAELQEQRAALDRHTEQISGDGGLQKTFHAFRQEFRAEVGSLRKAFYGLTAALIVASFSLIGAIIGHAV